MSKDSETISLSIFPITIIFSSIYPGLTAYSMFNKEYLSIFLVNNLFHLPIINSSIF
jgi:hypothetical protein